jgi:hypothetical protein
MAKEQQDRPGVIREWHAAWTAPTAVVPAPASCRECRQPARAVPTLNGCGAVQCLGCPDFDGWKLVSLLLSRAGGIVS